MSVDDCLLKVGQRVADRWDNDDAIEAWYDGTIISIDCEQRTADVCTVEQHAHTISVHTCFYWTV